MAPGWMSSWHCHVFNITYRSPISHSVILLYNVGDRLGCHRHAEKCHQFTMRKYLAWFFIYSRIWILAYCISDEILNFFVIYFSIYRGNICVTSSCTERNYSRKVPFSMNITLKRATRVTITRTLIRVHLTLRLTLRTDAVGLNDRCPAIQSWCGLDDWRVPKHCISSVVSKFAFW